jgi:hypothetical protein
LAFNLDRIEGIAQAEIGMAARRWVASDDGGLDPYVGVQRGTERHLRPPGPRRSLCLNPKLLAIPSRLNPIGGSTSAGEVSARIRVLA